MITVNVQSILLAEHQSRQVQLENGATVGDLLELLKLPVKEEALVVINGKNKLPDYLLQDGDKVAIFPIMDGG